MKIRSAGIIIGAIILALLAAFFVGRLILPGRKTVEWRKDFDSASVAGKSAIPKGWKLQRKPGTPPAVFSVAKNGNHGHSFLKMEADKASATLLCKVKNVDLKKTPILRWRWRAITLPDGADGAVASKDDQAIGIYVGAGRKATQKSVSYRWDTETPKGSEGSCRYGLGMLRVKWFTLRNKEDAKNGRWFVEERNWAEDFKKAWGFYPKTVYIGICCNSQYTGTNAEANLDWIEFMSVSSSEEKIQVEQ